ncbi:MAG: GNAT family N-acetyltransferase [Actinomycetota bacterium]|nr:GNAT family N-acetyltransferase [Actinomycetota bacterium]
MAHGLQIRPMLMEDWCAVAEIFAAGIATRNATFETAVPQFEEWDRSHRPDLRAVAMLAGHVVGWIAASPVSDRCCFGGVVEDSIYVAPGAIGRGVGRALLERFAAAADACGIWTIQAGIFPENRASMALHASCGFRLVGTRERLGQLDGTWRDVALLERRGPDPS